MSFDSKWSELSADQRSAAKDKHGSRESWQNAKARAQGFQDRSDFEKQRSAPPAPPTAQNTNQVQHAAPPPETKAFATPKPSTNGQALNNEHSPKANNVGNAAKPSVTPQESGYAKLKDYNLNYQGPRGTAEYNAGRDRIMRESGLSNNQYQQMLKADRKTNYDEAVANRETERNAYNQSRIDARAYAGETMVGKSDQSAYHQSLIDSGKGLMHGYGGTQDKADERSAIKQSLLASGAAYNQDEVTRHMNGGSRKADSLYEDYGGYDNWYAQSMYAGDNAFDYYTFKGNDQAKASGNYKTGGGFGYGNFAGSQGLIDGDVVQRNEVDRTNRLSDYYRSDEYAQKYGQYDFGQKEMNADRAYHFINDAGNRSSYSGNRTQAFDKNGRAYNLMSPGADVESEWQRRYG